MDLYFSLKALTIHVLCGTIEPVNHLEVEMDWTIQEKGARLYKDPKDGRFKYGTLAEAKAAVDTCCGTRGER